jgi:peptide/nickel transport system substrate-binding protein
MSQNTEAAPNAATAGNPLSGVVTRRALLTGAAALGAGAFATILSAEAAPRRGSSPGSQVNQDTAVAGGKLVIGLASEPDTLDIHVSPWAVTVNVALNIFDTLVVQDPADGSFKPGIATAWEVSPDGKIYTFTLRSDAKFHDGTALDANAVKFSFDRIVDPATKSGWASSFLTNYVGTEVVDPTTVKVSFSEPNAALLDGLSQSPTGIVSPAAVEKYGADFGINPVGSGPYIFKEWVQKDHLTVVKNPDYNWASPVFQHQGPAYLDEITFKFIAESATREGTLESDETQLIESVPESSIQSFEDQGYAILLGQAPGLPNAVLINTAKPPTDDLAVRRALIQATDAQSIIDTIFFGAYTRATAPLAKVSWAYNPDLAPGYAFDPAAAAKTLDDAGWTLNGDYREKDGNRLSIDLFFSADWDGGAYGELWQAQLKDAGIELKITQLDVAARITTAQNGQTNTVVNGWISSDPNILEHLFHSRNIGSGYNWVFYKDPALDGLLDQGAAELDAEKRKALYQQAQQILADQALLVPIYDIAAINGLSDKVKGVRVDARGFYRWLYDAWIAS